LSKYLSLLLAGFCAVGIAGTVHADNQVMSELRFLADKGADKNAGVWVDGQYVGYVKELKGDKKILLLPGTHEIVVRQAWYKDYVQEAVLEPGELHVVKIALMKQERKPTGAATAELKIAANPNRAAVFVDEQFAGHVNEFDGIGKAMLLTPGQHSVRIALPGYQPFETTVDLLPGQKMKIQTDLVKGSIAKAGSLVSQK